MRIVLARHGKAEDPGERPDLERELVEEGRRQAERMGRLVAGTLGVPERVWTSPLVRARQTAEAALAAMGETRSPEVASELAPAFGAEGLVRRIAATPAGLVLLVGHAPTLGRFAAGLAGAPVELPIAAGGLAVIESAGPSGPGKLLGLVDPAACAAVLEWRQEAPWKPDRLPDLSVWWDYNDPAASERRLAALEPGLAGPADRAQLYSQIARAQGLQQRFAEGHATLDRADGLAGASPVARLRCALERGRVENSSGHPDRARTLFERALELAQQAGEEALAVDAAHMLAIVAPPAEALEWNLRAIALAEASGRPRARQWLGSLYHNVAWTYHDLGDFPRALELFGKALDWRIEQGRPREIRIARWSVARALRSLGRLEEALAAQREILAGLEGSGESDGYVPEEIAECLLALGRPEEARPFFARAHELLSEDPWLARNEPARLERLAGLARGVSVQDQAPRQAT